MVSDKVRKWWILSSMCLLTVMLNIDITGINLAIPVIAHEFHASLTDMQWVINAFVLVSAMFQIFGGRLGDTYGQKKIFLIGTTIFIIGSAGAGLSYNEITLVSFRAVQGFALGIAYPMTIALTFAAFPKEKQGFALSFIVATMGISLAIGPPFGGFLVDTIGWRWIFYVNIPIGILCFIIAYIFCLPKGDGKVPPIDYKGTAFLALGLLGVLLAVNQLQSWGIRSYAFWISLLLGIFLLLLLYFVEKKQVAPIISFQLLKIRNFLLNNVIRIIVQLVFISVLFFFPLFLQNIAGYRPLHSGILLLFLTVVIGVLSPIAGKWVDRIGEKIPNILSMSLFAIAFFLFYFLTADPNLIVLGVGLLLVGIATGITFVSTVTGSVFVASEKEKGVASGMIFTSAWFGCALGIALMGAILSFASKSYLLKQLAHMQGSFSTTQTAMLERVSKGISSYKVLQDHFSSESVAQVTEIARNAFVHGLHISMLVWMFFSIFGVLLSLALKKADRIT